jgi:poly(ADP-ribose) glycohydrolase ARH3
MALEKVESLVASEEPDAVAARIGNGISALQAVPAALAAFLSNADSFRGTIRFAIRMGGDTDTIASMAGALSGAYLGEEAIPAVWRSRTEGARSMERLGGILFDHASAERHEP